MIFKFDNLFLRLLTRGRAETELLGQVPLADSDSGNETAPPLNLSRSLRYLFDAPR